MKRKTYLKALSAVILLTLGGCNSEPTRDVQYYLDHSEEMKAKIEQCKNNPGELMKTPNCQNAIQAENRRVFDSNNSEMPHIK